jgi:hypothetical protein
LEISGDKPMMNQGLPAGSQNSGGTKTRHLPDKLENSGDKPMMNPGLPSSSQNLGNKSESEASASGSAIKARKRLNELHEHKIEYEEKFDRARNFVIDTTVSTMDKCLRLSQRYTYFYNILIANASCKGKNAEGNLCNCFYVQFFNNGLSINDITA